MQKKKLACPMKPRNGVAWNGDVAGVNAAWVVTVLG